MESHDRISQMQANLQIRSAVAYAIGVHSRNKQQLEYALRELAKWQNWKRLAKEKEKLKRMFEKTIEGVKKLSGHTL